jgi:hypothetical protein
MLRITQDEHGGNITGERGLSPDPQRAAAGRNILLLELTDLALCEIMAGNLRRQ